MNDNEIHELVDRKQEDTFERVEKTIKVLTDFVAGENQEIKKSIDNLTLVVKEQNSSVRRLKEWKASVEGGKEAIKEYEKKSLSNWQVFGIICGSIISIVAVLGFIKGMNNSKQVDSLNYKLYWKEDRIPDSTVRSGNSYKVTEDTAYIRKLEKSTKELLK